MTRQLLDDHNVTQSTGSSSGVSSGGWLGIGIAIGFCIGLAIAWLLVRFLRWGVRQQPPQRTYSRTAPAFEGTASLSAVDTQAAHTFPKDAPQEERGEYYSPLSSSMVKSRRSVTKSAANGANMCLSPEATAALGGHGSAILHISRPMTAATTVQTGQYSTAVTPTRPTQTQPLYAAAPAFITGSAPQPAPQPACAPIAEQQQQQPQPATSQHQRMVSVAEAYGSEDLDAEWAVVLSDLDGMLAKRGQSGLASPERAVAVKTLIRFTGSRGMQFALEEALQDVLRFRGPTR